MTSLNEITEEVIEMVEVVAEEVMIEMPGFSVEVRDTSLVGLAQSGAADKRPTKICIDCGLPKLLSAFYTSTGTKDGRQSRCKECDGKRRAAHQRGEHPKGDLAKLDHERDVARKRAMEAKRPNKAAEGEGGVEEPERAYGEGVRNGPLIYGYIL
jgi:hypothetical protein